MPHSMANDSNGRVRLTWAQVTWCMAVLVVLISGWFRIEYRLLSLETTVKEGIYTKAAIDEMRRGADLIHDELRREVKAK